MLPSRSTRSSSRRSSILKPPKPRHPLQNLNFNSSSNESSPTTTNKIKRRVSFAEKKHVKEFCNSLEQGTVWDNTYEEHDLSYPKLSYHSNQQECETENPKEENIFYSRREEIAEQFIYNKVTENDLNVEDCSINVGNAVEDVDYRDELYCPVKLPLDSNSISQSIIIYEDKDEKLPEKVLAVSELSVNNVDYNKLNGTYLQNSCMDFTEVVCNNANYIQSTELEEPLKNESMEFTQTVLPVFNIQQFPKNVAEEQKSMELTTALASVIKFDEPDILGTAACFRDDTLKKFNISVTTTGVVSNKLCNIQTNFNELSCDNNDRPTIFDGISMEITNAVKTNICKPCDRLTVMQDAVEDKYDDMNHNENTKVLDMSMEMTKPVSINVHSVIEMQQRDEINCDIIEGKRLKYDLDAYEIPKNSNETRIYSDEGMEFTIAISNSSKIPQNNLAELILDSPNLHSSVLHNYRNDNANNATIYHNNSMTMTKVMPAFNTVTHQELGKTIIFPNTSMEITDAVTISQSHSEVESHKITESVLPETIKNRCLSKDSSSYIDMPSNDITVFTDPSVLKLASILKKGNSTLKNLENSAEESTRIEIQSSTNTKPSMALHESVCQDTCASAMKINNAETASVPSNSAELPKNEYLQDTASYSRRTYTIQSINNDQSFVISNAESNNISAVENDISDIFLMQNLEVLESIKPPSFLCLDDSSQVDISMNVNQEITADLNCVLRKENTDCEDSSNRNLTKIDQENSTNECIRKSQTFVINRVFANHLPDNLELEQKKQINPSEIKTLQLLQTRDTSADIEVLNCPGPKECSTSDVGGDHTKLCLGNNDVEYQSMECISSNIEVIMESENSNKTIEEDIKEAVNMQLKKGLAVDSSCSTESVSAEIDPFSTLITELKMRSKSDEIIWDVYHENIERNMFVIGFISYSLIIVIYLQDTCETVNEQYLKEIRIISRLTSEADVLISVTHRIILERLDTKSLLNTYKYRADLFPMLNHISQEVKLAMDFMFELKRLNDINLMEITRDSISFVSRNKRKDIILKITIDVKPFEKIEPENISVHCLLGSVKKEDIKKLITNIKRDHKFLRRYINDVRDYMYLMEEDTYQEDTSIQAQLFN